MSDNMESPPTVGSVVVRPDREPRMRRWAGRATLTLEIAASIIIFLMMILILANVFGRYVLNHPIQGTNEVVGYLTLPAVALIGYVVAQVRGQSIEADIAYQSFPRQIRREVRFATGLTAALACAGFGWFGWLEALHANRIGRTAPASDIGIAVIYWLAPAAFAVLTIIFVLDAVRAIRGRFDDEDFVAEAIDDPAIG